MKLSPREKQMLERIAEGDTIPTAASVLKISPHTANNYLRSAYLKLGVHNAAAAVARGLTNKNSQLSFRLG
jgi:DNA-binding CsgD family transcriptional regulator